jgi:hypothetical protein
METIYQAPTTEMAKMDRTLGFEARKFALETLVKIYLENASGSRALIVSHTRVMLTLAIAAIAAFVTIYAAMLRGAASTVAGIQPVSGNLALGGLGLLVASALLSTRAIALAAKVSTDLLRNPFPTARKELEMMFEARNEDIVLDNLVATVQLHMLNTATSRNFSIVATVTLIGGTTLAMGSLLISHAQVGW